MSSVETGHYFENEAIHFLNKNHIRILERNFRSKYGEIDLIGRDQEYYVFFEVKYRKSNVNGLPEEAVNKKKQKRICRTADFYRYLHRLDDFTPIRYDVIAFSKENVQWIKNAYYHQP